MVLGIARISTEGQDRLSLNDQRTLLVEWLDQHCAGPYNLAMIAEQGSGECTDRAGILAAWDRIRSEQFDLVIAEDLGRIYRRAMAQQFCEHCEDYGTRLVAINDNIDTAQPNWRLMAGFASIRHELYNADTAKRIRRTHRSRFQDGGIIQFVIYGIIKPPGAKHDSELQKDPAAQAIYEEMFRRLEQSASYAEVADWLNALGIPTGLFCRIKRWTGPMVARIVHNPILKGMRVRNRHMSRRINSTGHHRSVKAPAEELLERQCPHLAFFEAEYYDRVIRLLDARNACYKRKGTNGRDTRKGVPKKRTTWPGQHLCCGICNRMYYWTGIGERKLMKCSGSQNYQCWNAVEVNGELIARKLLNAIFNEIMSLPGFDAALQDEFVRHWDETQSSLKERRQEIRRRLEANEKGIANVTAAVAEIGISPALHEKLHQLERDQQSLRDELSQLEQAKDQAPAMPSIDALRAKAKELVDTFVPGNPEMQRLMRELIGDLRVFPYQLCDGGWVVLRAHFELRLEALTGGAWPETGPAFLHRTMVVDLFDPPQRERFRTQVVALRGEGRTERAVAAILGIKQPAVQYAMALARRMAERGLTDPYVPVTDPAAAPGLSRHRHRRYRFEPLDKPPELG
jgi:DNA invertase Pin-like site-specific DNA recombinase